MGDPLFGADRRGADRPRLVAFGQHDALLGVARASDHFVAEDRRRHQAEVGPRGCGGEAGDIEALRRMVDQPAHPLLVVDADAPVDGGEPRRRVEGLVVGRQHRQLAPARRKEVGQIRDRLGAAGEQQSGDRHAAGAGQRRHDDHVAAVAGGHHQRSRPQPADEMFDAARRDDHFAHPRFGDRPAADDGEVEIGDHVGEARRGERRILGDDRQQLRRQLRRFHRFDPVSRQATHRYAGGRQAVASEAVGGVGHGCDDRRDVAAHAGDRGDDFGRQRPRHGEIEIGDEGVVERRRGPLDDDDAAAVADVLDHRHHLLEEGGQVAGANHRLRPVHGDRRGRIEAEQRAREGDRPVLAGRDVGIGDRLNEAYRDARRLEGAHEAERDRRDAELRRGRGDEEDAGSRVGHGATLPFWARAIAAVVARREAVASKARRLFESGEKSSKGRSSLVQWSAPSRSSPTLRPTPLAAAAATYPGVGEAQGHRDRLDRDQTRQPLQRRQDSDAPIFLRRETARPSLPREPRLGQPAENRVDRQCGLHGREQPADDLERHNADETDDGAGEQHAGEVQGEHRREGEIDLPRQRSVVARKQQEEDDRHDAGRGDDGRGGDRRIGERRRRRRRTPPLRASVFEGARVEPD